MKESDIILIADDDDGHIALIKKNLKIAGIMNKTKSFKNGKEVLAFLHSCPEESYILLLDINMPKLSGIEVLEKIKADPRLNPIPVIMFTTSDDAKSIKRCEGLGCTDYIVKYIDYEKFVSAIQELGESLKSLDVPSIS